MFKKSWLTILLALGVLALVGARPVQADDGTAAPRVITVTGEAEIKTAPDEVILVLGVETSDKNIQVAKGQNDERVKRVIALTKEYGIDPKYVQTDQINIEPRYHDSYTPASFIGFFVRKTIVVTLKDLTRFEGLLTAALSWGVTHVQGIQFRTTELLRHREQARTLAIRAAQDKATALAGALGQKAGKPQRIDENYSGWTSWYSTRWGGNLSQNVIQNNGGGAVMEEGTLAPGQISVTARVSVTFALE